MLVINFSQDNFDSRIKLPVAGSARPQDDASKLAVEIGLAHDHTQDKWLAKLDHDADKLRRDLGGIRTLHLIVLTSRESIEGNKVWENWLSRLRCWPTGTTPPAHVPSPSSGAWEALAPRTPGIVANRLCKSR